MKRNDARCQELKKELSRNKSLYEMDKKALNDDLRELRVEHKLLIDKSKDDHSKMKRLKLQTKAACTQLKSTEQELTKCKNEIKLKSNQIEAIQQKYKNITTEQGNKYKSLEIKLKSVEQKNLEHVDKMYKLQDQIVAFETDRKKCNEFHVDRKDVELLQNELKAVKQKYNESKSNLKELQSAVDKVIKEIENLKSVNNNLENKCIEYKQQKIDLNKKLKQLTENNEYKETQYNTLKEEREKLLSTITELQQELNKTRQQLNEIQATQLRSETEKNQLHNKISKYMEETEALHIQMQSLWRNFEAEKSKAKMWKLKLKTFVEQQQYKNANIAQWLSQCKQNTKDSGINQAADVAISNGSGNNEDEDEDDSVLKSPIHFPSPFETSKLHDSVLKTMNDLKSISKRYNVQSKSNENENDKEEVSESEQDNDSDIDPDVESALNALFLTPSATKRNIDSESDVSTPSQFDHSVGTPSSSNFDSDIDQHNNS